MKKASPKTVICLTVIYVGFALVTGYNIYEGCEKPYYEMSKISYGNFKIPKP